MSDRELLEMAAKGVGQEIVWLQDDPDVDFFTGESPSIPNYRVLEKWNWKTWDPLLDDGEALRIAVRLLASIDFRKPGTSVWVPSIDFIVDDKCHRRAIVKAAAEVGRRMK